MCAFELKQFKLKIKSTATVVYVIFGGLSYTSMPVYMHPRAFIVHAITLTIPKGFSAALCTLLTFAPLDIEHVINNGSRNNC